MGRSRGSTEVLTVLVLSSLMWGSLGLSPKGPNTTLSHCQAASPKAVQTSEQE
jgi:hypothetical protein